MVALVSFLDKAGLSAFWYHIRTVLIEPIMSTLTTHISDKANPHGVTKTQVGLANVTNDAQVKRSEMGKASGVATLGTDGKIPSSQIPSNGTLTTHIANKDNPHGVTKTQVGLANVTNDAQVKRSEMGKASGVATLGTDGKIPSSQLPSYVDDVIEGYYNPEDEKFYTQKGTDDTYDAANQITGETGKIYVDLGTDDNIIYRYAGTSSTYVPISDVPAAVMEEAKDLWDAVDTKADSAKVSALESKVDTKADSSTVSSLESKFDTKADSSTVSSLESKVNALVGDNSEQYKVLSNIALGLTKQGITYDSASRKLTITLYCGTSKGTQSFEIDGVSDTDINALTQIH